jgi:UPF0755 protein
MKTHTSILKPACLFIFLLLAGSIGLGWGAYQINNQARIEFGPPASGHNWLQNLQMSAELLWHADDLTKPANPQGEVHSFQVPLGASIPEIASRLKSEGLIRNADTFRLYLIYAGLDTTLQAGEYLLDSGMTSLEIARRLQDATPSEVSFTILPGWRIEEIAASLPTSGLPFSPEDFLRTCQSSQADYPFLRQLPPGASLEGFLFPDSYHFPRQVTALEVIDTFLDNFTAHLTSELIQGFTQQGLDVYQAVTLASIVQREAVLDDEMPIIASVFLNRLGIGMSLEADSTVQYALGYDKNKATWWTNPLSTTDLQINSPYNTYHQAGLPPGPISNPSLTALRSVAFPARTPYYYFRAACDGSGRHTFSETFDQHIQQACP